MKKTVSLALNILILNYEYPPIGGGAGVISQFHAQYLADLGHNLTVVTASENNTFYVDKISEALKIVKLPSKRYHQHKSGFREKISWMLSAKKYLLHKDNTPYDVSMAHFSIPGGWVALHLKNKKQIPYVVISHGQDVPWFYPKQMFLYHLILAPFIKHILNQSGALCVQSNAMFKNAIQFLKKTPSKVKLIPNGCDNTLFRTNTNNIDLQCIKLLFVGRLTQQKRPLILIEIAKALSEQGINFYLTICGDGVKKQEMTSLTHTYGLNKKIRFTGWINQEGIKKMYHNHDIMLLPSEAEGMSIAVLEALFSGLYVISTAVSGNTDIFDNYKLGKTVPYNVSEFVKAITTFISSPNSTEREIELYQFKEIYNWQNIVNQYERILLDVATSK